MSTHESIPPIQEIVENFGFFDDWHDRFEYLLDLGKRLPPLPEAERTSDAVVQGCQAMVWLVLEPRSDSTGSFGGSSHNTGFELRAVSDAHMVNGLLAILLSFYHGQSLAEAARADPMPTLRSIDLEDHLSPTRRNGLHAMVQRIKALCDVHARNSS